jgi:hypothetical protein
MTFSSATCRSISATSSRSTVKSPSKAAYVPSPFEILFLTHELPLPQMVSDFGRSRERTPPPVAALQAPRDSSPPEYVLDGCSALSKAMQHSLVLT